MMGWKDNYRRGIWVGWNKMCVQKWKLNVQSCGQVNIFLILICFWSLNKDQKKQKYRPNLGRQILGWNTSRKACWVISITYRSSDHISSSNQDRQWSQVDWVKLGKAMPIIYPQIWYGWLIRAPPHTHTHTHARAHTNTKKHASKLHASTTHTNTSHPSKLTHTHGNIHTPSVVQPTTTVTEWDTNTQTTSIQSFLTEKIFMFKSLIWENTCGAACEEIHFDVFIQFTGINVQFLLKFFIRM